MTRRPPPPKSSYDHLKVLEKSVGRWEGALTSQGQKFAATLTVEWMLDKQFLREELRIKFGAEGFSRVTIRGWDAKAGVMTEHEFASYGESAVGTAKFGASPAGKVAITSSAVWASDRKVSAKRVVEFPRTDRMVIALTEQTQDGKALPDAKLELTRAK